MKKRIVPPKSMTDALELRRFFENVCNEISKTQKGSCTLTASSATTTVADINVRDDSSILLFPMTANAQADYIAGMRISDRTKGVSFEITHPNNANSDKNFTYIIQN